MAKKLCIVAIGVAISIGILLAAPFIPAPVNPSDCYGLPASSYNPEPGALYLAIFIWFCLISYLFLSVWHERWIGVITGIVGTLLLIWIMFNLSQYLPLPCTPVISEIE